MKKLIGKLLEKLLAKPLQKLARHIEKWNAEAAAARAAEEARPETSEPETQEPYAKPWRECRYSSNWSGTEASKRMMNLVSPKFSEAKVREYLDWQQSLGCDHVHLLLVNQGDGEGAGYDCLADAGHKAVALARVRDIRARGLGVVAWVVSDDSDDYRRKIFDNPAKYADALKEFMPYLSYVVLGLEMNEGEGSKSKWTALRDAIRKAGWTGPFATHHTSGHGDYASLGQIVMDQLDKGCSEAQIRKSVEAFRAKGYDVCGFEYARGPDKARAKAALDAGAFSVGNWAGGKPISTASSQEKEAAGTDAGKTSAATAHDDAVDFSILNWSYGGFNGKSAKLDSRARIFNLTVKAEAMTYRWIQGGCEDLGAASRDHADCLACLFVLVGGAWRGGKFDWISTSRQTRDFKNIEGSYNGWPKDSIGKASKYAFCIVGKDGKSRTNVITCGK